MTEQLPVSPGDAPALIPLLLVGAERTRAYLLLATEALLDQDKHALVAINIR